MESMTYLYLCTKAAVSREMRSMQRDLMERMATLQGQRRYGFA